MTAFARAVDALFRDPNLGVDALYRAGGEGAGQPLRAMLRRPDQVAAFGGGRFVQEGVLIDLRVADVAALAPGDTVEIAGTVYELRGEPIRDADRLVWSAEGRAL